MNTINTSINFTNITNATTISSSTKENFFATPYFIIMVVSVILLVVIIFVGTVLYVLLTQKDDTISPQTKSQYSQTVSNATPIPKNNTSNHQQNMSEFHIALQTFKNNKPKVKQQKKNKEHVPVTSLDIDLDNLSDISEEDQVKEIKTKSPKSPKYKTVINGSPENNKTMDEESSLSVNTDSSMRDESQNNNNNSNNNTQTSHKWNCLLCTYKNDMNITNCKMCLTPQPLSLEDDDSYDDYNNDNNNNNRPPPKFQPRIKPLPPPRKPRSPKQPYITKV